MPPFNKSLVPATVETNKSLGYYKRIYGMLQLAAWLIAVVFIVMSLYDGIL